MKQRLLIVLFTALVFGAGFGAHMWIADDATVPAPPAPGSEFVRASTPVSTDTKADHKGRSSDPLHDRARVATQIEQLRPQIDAYRRRVDEIAADFDRDLQTILTPQQRELFDAQQKRNAERRAKGEAKEAADTGPLTDEQITMLQQRPLWYVLRSVAINWRLDQVTKDMKLDEPQQAKVRDLLKARREKFIALVDSTPPPSIYLNDLARRAQKLGEPAKKSEK